MLLFFMAKLPYNQLVCGENVYGKDATVKVRTYKGVPPNPSCYFLLQLPTTSPGIPSRPLYCLLLSLLPTYLPQTPSLVVIVLCSLMGKSLGPKLNSSAWVSGFLFSTH